MRHLFLIFIFASFIGISQTNLIPNYSFETYSTCPTSLSKINFAVPWFQPSCGDADLYSSCAPIGSYVNIPNTRFGHSYARSGNGMAGLALTSNALGGQTNVANGAYREYVAVRLTQSLVAGQSYFVSFYLKLADTSRFAGSHVGLFFSADSITSITLPCDTITANPQINNAANNFITSKTTWTKMTGNFTAVGGEKYVYIGNFNPAKNDTLRVVPGHVNSLSFVIHPYYFIDDICVSTDESYCEALTGLAETDIKNGIRIFPNPVTNKLTLEFNQVLSLDRLVIFNALGEQVFQLQHPKTKQEIDLQFLEPGIYFLRLQNAEAQKTFKIIKE
ncbi:MAG TPA: T9SS type A sorting domain-containing protein [Bacteroidia bacterium]|nr:T9SS type A sorting domain-containing protein [Bacteroidia bacterium]